MAFVFFRKDLSEEDSSGASKQRNCRSDAAQLSMLLEGIDWRRPVRSYDRKWRCERKDFSIFWCVLIML